MKRVRKKNNQCKRKRPKMKGGAAGNTAAAVLVKIIAGCIGVIVVYGLFFQCDEWKFPHDLCHAVRDVKDTLSKWLLLVPFAPAILGFIKSSGKCGQKLLRRKSSSRRWRKSCSRWSKSCRRRRSSSSRRWRKSCRRRSSRSSSSSSKQQQHEKL